MKALQITGYGDLEDNLAFNEIDKPKVGAHQVLIEVHAAGVNPVDYKIVEGALKQVRKLDFPASIGFDIAGIVVEKGNQVDQFGIGDEVYARTPSDATGTFAEYVAVDEGVVSLKPTNTGFEAAAGLQLVGLTTVQAFDRANLQSGDKVLIHAGSGGIGTFAVQYAKSKGAYVYTTTSTNNVDWVKELGADRVIDYKTENYLDVVKDVDVVYDTLGGNYTLEAFEVIKKGGKVVSLVGDVDEETARELGLNGLIRFILRLKRRSLTKQIKKKSAYYKLIVAQSDGPQLEDIKKLVEAGAIEPIVDKIFPFPEAKEALRYQQSGRAKGKIIIKIK